MQKLSRILATAVLCTSCFLVAVSPVHAEREYVLPQIDLPHHYYYREMYLPQLTSGPSSLAWSPDSSQVVYSMQGSLWVQAIDATTARQLTAGPGYDYQPDWSSDGRSILFARYFDDAIELHVLDLITGDVRRLTESGAVNVEPRWSPDGKRIAWVSTIGSGRFHIRVGAIEAGQLAGERLRPEQESASRYYYSTYDHEISPAWSPDGAELLFVSNPDVAWGTGGIWRLPLTPGAETVLVRDEETTWKAKPDWSPDGKRVTWSSYHGRQWHQLWITTSRGGGDPLPLSYGDFDITAARWSPDGRYIGFISNQSGNTALWLQESVGGARRPVEAKQREYLHPMGELDLRLTDASGRTVAARVSVTGSDDRSYAPDQAWIHADDGFDRRQAALEQHYFHSPGESLIRLPAGEARITVWRGLENAIARGTIDIPASGGVSLELQSLPLGIPDGWQDQWISGDVHVHMNYGGAYRNTPARLVSQAKAEDLDVVFNLVVNKEQRIPDIDYFSTEPDRASDSEVLLLHGQEFHTGYWGHLGLLGLDNHLLIPDYSAYPNTGMASPFPDNNTVADLAHRQNALVGYVHPYDKAPDPEHDAVLTNALPIAVALGKVDYYEVSGFADYRETQQVWYRLLNCGFRLAAAGGTDAMANYASLRGPVGLNRVYVRSGPGFGNDIERRDRWLKALKAGASLATNGPIMSFELDGQQPGGKLTLPAGDHTLGFQGFMRSIVPVDHLEVVVNGKVVQTIRLEVGRTAASFESEITLDQSGWVLLRAWNEDASPDIFDRFPYATTNPVFVDIGGQPVRSDADADYFIRWIERVRGQTLDSLDYNTEAERQAVLSSIDAALKVFKDRRQETVQKMAQSREFGLE